MIIDFHAHWWPSDMFVHAKPSWDIFIQGVNGTYYKPAKVDLTDNELKALYFDPEGAKLLKQMEEAGVDMTVLLPLDWGNVFGLPEMDIVKQNEVYAKLSKTHSDKIISFFTIDPIRENGSQYFQKAVKDWGMKGLKLYPPTGFFPFDDICMPFYKTCLNYGLPVVFHGTTSPISPIEYCHPDGFKKLADKLPELKIVIAHSGGLAWHVEALNACLEYDNIYLDISGLQSILDLEMFKGRITNMFSTLKSFEKVLFGTDNPIFNGMCSVKNMVSHLQGLDLPEIEKKNLLGNTAKRIMNLM